MEKLGQDWCTACQHALQAREHLQARRMAGLWALAWQCERRPKDKQPFPFKKALLYARALNL